MTIGEFSQRSRLSAKALRLYADLGLLVPAHVDPGTGYRYYRDDQLERARLVATLRRLGMGLAEIAEVVALTPPDAAQRVEAYWAGVEAEHAARRALSVILVDRLNGKSTIMYDVTTRTMPARALVCLESRVESESEVWALGKRFIGILRAHPMPRLDGVGGAMLLVYDGEVNEDSDGPVAMCLPVPDDQADALAAAVPGLSVRREPEHEEAVVMFGAGSDLSAAQRQLMSESFQSWVTEHHRRPSGLGMRVDYLHTVTNRANSGDVPDVDFAVPLA